MNTAGERRRNMKLFTNWGPYLEAEGGNDGGAGTEGGKEPEGGQNPTEPKSFDDFLKSNPDYQKELDRRLQKASETAAENARQKEAERQEALYSSKLTEQEKMAQMNDEEKAKYLREKAEKDLADREKAVTERELKAQAREMLIEKGVDPNLADVAKYTDADSCKKSVDAIIDSFSKSVEARVEEKLKGTKPPKDAGTEGAKDKSAKELEVFSAMGVK